MPFTMAMRKRPMALMMPSRQPAIAETMDPMMLDLLVGEMCLCCGGGSSSCGCDKGMQIAVRIQMAFDNLVI